VAADRVNPSMKAGEPSGVEPGPELAMGQAALMNLGPRDDAMLATGEIQDRY
jgi:hypothetical protein